MTRFGNRIGVWMYRTLDGRLAGPKGVHVLLLTTERDTTWQNVILAQAPDVARYADRAHRTIPVALLKPIES